MAGPSLTPSPSSSSFPKPSSRLSRGAYWQWAIAIAGIIGLALYGLSFALAEGLWFQEVGYLHVFWTQFGTRLGLGLFAFGISFSWLYGNLVMAQRWGNLPPPPSPSDRPNAFNRQQQWSVLKLPGAMRLWELTITSVTLGLLVIALLMYHSQLAISHWYPEFSLMPSSGQIPAVFRPEMLWQIVWTPLQRYPWILGGVPALLVAIALYPRSMLKAIALGMSIAFSLLLSTYWRAILLAFHPVAFTQTDPIFRRDIGFYVFQLPVWELIAFWLMGLFLLAFVSVALLYLLMGKHFSQGYFPGFSRPQRRHLYALSSPVMGAIALTYWVDRYELLYSPTGVTYGASYTNVTAQLPIYTGLTVLAVIISLYFLVRAIFYPHREGNSTALALSSADADVTVFKRPALPPDLKFYMQPSAEQSSPIGVFSTLQSSQPPLDQIQFYGKRADAPPSDFEQRDEGNGQRPRSIVPSSPFRSCAIADDAPSPGWSPLLVLSLLYVVVTLVGSSVIPPLVQRLIVQPNELAREKPYLEYTIESTRKAFDLDEIDVQVFDPKTTLTYEDLLNNTLTINNIRLWDTRPLLDTNRQLQRIRLYYEFPDADIDRYTFYSPGRGAATNQPVTDYVLEDQATETASETTSDTRQVLISARELDYSNVPDEAKTWVNEHLIYTHGYGFTMSPVNTATDSGLPDYFIRGIEHTPSNAIVRNTIPVNNPRIYYGELTNTYVMTPTAVEELDYPSGSENVYTTYQGQGGVAIGPFWRRLLYANYLGDWRMMLTNNFTPETKLLMRRTIGNRIRTIAPFLRYDSDPYLVVADTTLPSHTTRSTEDSANPRSNLFWVIDAYTTSDRYPYSDPIVNDFNYIRNSVKVVVDAYNGTVEFYMADATDPMIQAWNQIFPNMFRPLDTMPTPILSHIRYPKDYYQVQSDHLMTYHMTDPRVLYNREDQWRSPREIYGAVQQSLQPYYLLMKLPTEDEGEFILLHPYTPSQRRNLIAWLAARSDGITEPSAERNHYGKQLLYVFPKQELVFGPEQIEARINQDPAISEQISLWNRTGSRAIQGNLLVIPIEQSLLYIEPLYLEAEQDQLPTLVRVIAVYDNRIAMEETLSDALKAVFNREQSALPQPS